MMLDRRNDQSDAAPEQVEFEALAPQRPGTIAAGQHHFMIVLLDTEFSLQVAWVLDILAETNRAEAANRFSWEVMPASLFLRAERENWRNAHHAEVQSRSAVFLAEGPLDLTLDDVSRERFRQAIGRLTMAVACGPAVELFAACSVLNEKSAAACRATRAWLCEKYPQVGFIDGVVHWNGHVGTSAGGAATAKVILEALARLGFAELSSDVAGRLLIPHGSHARSSGIQPKTRYGVRGTKITKAIAFMEQNLEEELHIETVAAHVGSSIRQLERLFKTQLNTTPARFVKMLRLDRAKELLANTELSVVQVSCATGFENPTHFSKCFKHRFSTAPTAWRDVRRDRGKSSAQMGR